MTNGSTLTHLIVIEALRRSNPLVVADAGALPEEADDRVALVIPGQPSVALESVVPALEKPSRDLVCARRKDRRGCIAQTGEHRREVSHGDAAAAIDRHEPLG